jgi:cytidylate kinase
MTDRAPFHLVVDTSRWDVDVIVDTLERLARALRAAPNAC